MVSAQITGMNTGVYSAGNAANAKSKNSDTAMDFGMVMSRTVSDNAHTRLVGEQDFSKIKTDVKSTENNVKVQQPQKTEKQTSDTEVAQEVAEVTEKIADKVKEKLGLSDEELEELLAGLGMTIGDLTDTSKLTRLVAEAMGQEGGFSLITNEEFLTNVNELTDFIDSQMEGLAKELDIEPEKAVQLFVENTAEDVAEEEEKPAVMQPDRGEGNGQLADKIEIVSLKTDKAYNTAYNTASDFNQDNGHSLSENSQKKQVDVSVIATEINNSVEAVFTEIIGDETTAVDGADIVRQIIDAVKVTAGNDFTSMEIALNPENLGKINLTVVARNGSVTAQLVAENETVKRAIEAQLTVLKNNFEQQGIKVDAVEVTVASHSFENNTGLAKGNQENQQNGQSRRRNLKLDSLEDLNDEELSPQELKIRQLLDDNSSVEFKA